MQNNSNKFRFKKKFGQNFIKNDDILRRIIDSISNPSGSLILEIGPGSGSLTKFLLSSKPEKLVAIEIDNHLMPQLNEVQKNSQGVLQIINADALEVSEENFFSGKFKIIANLPYNIGTLLLIKWLKKLVFIDEIIIMLQQEVAERITAQKCSKSYGRISILSQSLCHCEKLFDVSPENFYPKPQVYSSVVKLTPKYPLLTIEAIEKLEKTCKVSFNSRRKKIKTNLKKFFPNIENLLMDIHIDPNSRAEDLSVDEFFELSKKLNFN